MTIPMQPENRHVRSLAGPAVAALLLVTGCSAAMRYSAQTQGLVEDPVPRMRIQSEPLSRKYPAKPVLAIPSGTAAIAEIVPLPGNRILVGHTIVRGWGQTVFFPEHGPYIAYDEKSGHRLWAFERASDYEKNNYRVVLTEPALVIEKRGEKDFEQIVLEPSSGKVLWRASLPVGSVGLGNAERGIAFLVSAGRDRTLEARELLSGKTLWSVALARGPDDLVSMMFVQGDRLIVATDPIVAYDTATGRVAWTAPESGALSAAPVQTGQGVAFAFATGKILSLRTGGEITWQASVSGRPRALSCNSGTCVIEVPFENSAASRLYAFESANGRQRWRKDTSGPVMSSLSLANGFLAYTVGNKLELVELRSGKILRSSPGLFGPRDRLPDHVIAGPERIVVASETSLHAYAVPGGGLLWSYPYLYQPTYASALEELDKLFAPNVATRGSTATKSAASEGFKAATASLGQSNRDSVRWAQQHRANVDTLSAPSMRASASRSDRLQAMSERSAASSFQMTMLSSNAAFERSMASANLVAASADFMVNASTIGQQIAEANMAKSKAIETRVTVPWLLNEHLAAIQGRYFVRSMAFDTDQGGVAGVLVVDLDDGRWAQAVTTPKRKRSFMGRVPSVVSVDSARVLTIGTDLDPARWIVNDDLPLEKVVMPSILGYDISKLTFRAPESFRTDALHAAAGIKAWPALNAAAKRDDSGFVEAMLDAGVPVNVRPGSWSALAEAAGEGHVETVRLLLDRGANVNHKTSGSTPLASAAGRHREVVRLLLERGADPNTSADTTLWTPPIVSEARAGNEENVVAMLEKKADPNALSWMNLTPLMQAARFGHAAMVTRLVQAGADPNLAAPNGGCPLASAKRAEQRREEVESALRAAGASEEKCIASAKAAFAQRSEKFPIVSAANSGNLDLVKALLDGGANPNTTSASGATPLMFASELGYADIVKMLVDRGANVRLETKYGNALSFAKRRGHKQVVEILEAGAR
jgi:ankyrin repeat protein/outer membrane protein assembly factor BamB